MFLSKDRINWSFLIFKKERETETQRQRNTDREKREGDRARHTDEGWCWGQA